LEHYDAHHVSDNLSGKFEWVDMDHTLFAFLVETLSNIVINLFSDFRVEFFLADLPPTFQGVIVASHAVFEAGIRVVSVVGLSVDKVADLCGPSGFTFEASHWFLAKPIDFCFDS
jgi:hypothetical protein